MVRTYGRDQTRLVLTRKAEAWYSGSNMWIKEVENDFIVTYTIGVDGEIWADGLTEQSLTEYLEDLQDAYGGLE